MKKIKSIIIICLLVATVLKFDKVIIGTMYLVDGVGTITNTSTIETIDRLNDVYYNLGYK